MLVCKSNSEINELAQVRREFSLTKRQILKIWKPLVKRDKRNRNPKENSWVSRSSWSITKAATQRSDAQNKG